MLSVVCIVILNSSQDFYTKANLTVFTAITFHPRQPFKTCTTKSSINFLNSPYSSHPYVISVSQLQ